MRRRNKRKRGPGCQDAPICATLNVVIYVDIEDKIRNMMKLC